MAFPLERPSRRTTTIACKPAPTRRAARGRAAAPRGPAPDSATRSATTQTSPMLLRSPLRCGFGPSRFGVKRPDGVERHRQTGCRRHQTSRHIPPLTTSPIDRSSLRVRRRRGRCERDGLELLQLLRVGRRRRRRASPAMRQHFDAVDLVETRRAPMDLMGAGDGHIARACLRGRRHIDEPPSRRRASPRRRATR